MSTPRILFAVVGFILLIIGIITLYLESRGAQISRYYVTFSPLRLYFSVRMSLVYLWGGIALLLPLFRSQWRALNSENVGDPDASASNGSEIATARVAKILQRASGQSGAHRLTHQMGKSILGLGLGLLGALIVVGSGLLAFLAFALGIGPADALILTLALFIGVILAVLGAKILSKIR